MAQGRHSVNADGTFTPTDHGTAPRPDLNSENDLLRRILQEQRTTNLLLAQAFGIPGDIRAIFQRDTDTYPDTTYPPT